MFTRKLAINEFQLEYFAKIVPDLSETNRGTGGSDTDPDSGGSHTL